MIILSHKRQDTIVMMIPCLCSFRSSSCDLRHKKIPRPNGLAASFLVDIPTRWEPRTNQSPARALIAPPAARPCCSSPVPPTTKNPQTEWSGDVVEHCPQQPNLNLFQILRQIPSTSQHTVNLHDLVFIVDAVEHQILVNDHPTISRVKAVDLAHFRGIA